MSSQALLGFTKLEPAALPDYAMTPFITYFVFTFLNPFVTSFWEGLFIAQILSFSPRASGCLLCKHTALFAIWQNCVFCVKRKASFEPELPEGNRFSRPARYRILPPLQGKLAMQFPYGPSVGIASPHPAYFVNAREWHSPSQNGQYNKKIAEVRIFKRFSSRLIGQ
ncbi:hypothetical protein COX84_03470 [Candidatus Micrarchaeota archaeon CG_4_10_14_0_2_um_filter_49_7]|nr:MAG: hypothetical protein COS70_04300 [Candidatus Micrarchaeota archaeon CG06_land_8_20_14_3_00_50_6]PIZ97007.1 MAG: hypothetical protein COX84_03470 [Candidatus Micrarchaeota archaeon CG_4_10_14_0_2_um_filter_49_7]